MASFQTNAKVARSHVRAQQLKGWFMANAQLLAVSLSGIMMFMGVMLLYTGIKLEFTMPVLLTLVAAWPVALVGGCVAVIVEGMTIIAANGLREANRKIEQEVSVINKIAKGFTPEEKAAKIKKVRQQKYLPMGLLFLFAFFSLAGAEIFWHIITKDAGAFFVVIGYVIGAVVSVSLTYIEMNHDLIERGIDRAISSSAMLYRAMEMDAKGQILNALSDARSKQLESAEFKQITTEAARSSLHGVYSETVSNMGASVSAEQLKRMVTSKSEERAAAEAAIANGGVVDADTNPNIPKIGPGSRKEYNTEAKRKVRDLVARYTQKMVLADPEKYAAEIGVSVNTIKKYA